MRYYRIDKNNTSKIPVPRRRNVNDVSGLYPSDFDEGHRPEASVIFLPLGTGIVLVLFYIYSIIPDASAFLHGSQLLVTVAKGVDPKRHLYFYPLVLELFLSCSISIR